MPRRSWPKCDCLCPGVSVYGMISTNIFKSVSSRNFLFPNYFLMTSWLTVLVLTLQLWCRGATAAALPGQFEVKVETLCFLSRTTAVTSVAVCLHHVYLSHTSPAFLQPAVFYIHRSHWIIIFLCRTWESKSPIMTEWAPSSNLKAF